MLRTSVVVQHSFLCNVFLKKSLLEMGTGEKFRSSAVGSVGFGQRLWFNLSFSKLSCTDEVTWLGTERSAKQQQE